MAAFEEDSVKPKKGIFRGVGRFLDIFRKIILNLVFWAFVILVAIALIPPKIRIKEDSLLYLKPEGTIVDAVTHPPYAEILSPFLNMASETSSLEIGDAVLAAAEDDRIMGIVLDLSDMQYASLAVLQDLEKDLEHFKESGKNIYAWAPEYNQYAYYLASVADRIFLDEMGRVLLSGFGVYRSYFKKGMDKWDLNMAVFQAGEYKSFVEPYLYEGMSEQVRQDNLRWIGTLWNQVLQAVGGNRSIPPSQLKDWVDRYPEYLKQASGSEAAAARDAGLVDTLGTWRDFSSEMTRITGYDSHQEGFRSLHWLDYTAYLAKRPSLGMNKTVAIVTARGEIHSGEGTQWTIGSDTLIQRLEQAENESSVRAIVLRLDTGGGSAYASEEIRRTLERIRERGIPVVVSMGGVTASGGYWIASESDELWSAPGSITGSIGVFSMMPETDRFLEEHLGIQGDGVGTTWTAGQGRPDQPLNPSSRFVLQSGVDSIYERFLTIISENRGLEKKSLLPLAGGRIWTGEEALKNGLNDKIGTLREAAASAAKLAHLEQYDTWYVPDYMPSLSELVTSPFGFSGKTRLLTGILGLYSQELEKNLSGLEAGKVYALSPISSGHWTGNN